CRRVLYSVPTRRSSDLGACRVRPAAGGRTTAAGKVRVGGAWQILGRGPRSMADYTLDAVVPQMVACCDAAAGVHGAAGGRDSGRSEEHTSELQSRANLV